ncbi:ankyrin repeat and SOCS box protein 15-like [Puntigrus tetrazona]|uniref:ankyrin repeat and SOCS box protein 15b n=1 Tax=Puntigrus tetrazona TaxID=1606681 RepID=UPI001C8ADCEC|nr:ankyrin repeat and SOCS box protein 15b [Puntigrus tetrazona]XP_043093825.1 ankyrin repeat and SOCS box protein 15-like [Puntigrus tetrazona]
MDYMEQMDEDQLIDFVIQMSLQDACGLSVLNEPLSTLETASDENLKILSAIDQGDVFALRHLHKYSDAYKERDSKGWLPMHRASVQPDAHVLDSVLLASHELSMEEMTTDGDTALTLACGAGHVENVKVLLQHGASPHNMNSRNENPLLLAVRANSYEMVHALVMRGAFVQQVCLKKWTVIHEAAKVGCVDILMLLLRHGGKVMGRDGHGVTPLGIAAEYGHPEILAILIQHGGDVTAQAANGDSVLYDAAGCGNLDCIGLLLQHGASPNVASLCSQLPIHRAAYEGHYLALKTFIPITTKRAIRLSGMSPVHSAADGGQADCLELLITKGFDVNPILGCHISENYGDMRKTPLYFAICNGDVTCAEMLLKAGAKPDLDPLRCLLVAVRAGKYELVRLLLAYGADVNCVFSVVSDTLFPTALQYCLKDEMMLRLLLNNGYHAESCFECYHDNCVTSYTWVEASSRSYQIKTATNKVTFCEFISVSWMAHLAGRVVLTLLDYVNNVRICSKLQRILERQEEWLDICDVLRNPRSLKHQARLVIRGCMTLRRLNDPEIMSTVPFPPALKNFLLYKEYDIYGRMDEQ